MSETSDNPSRAVQIRGGAGQVEAAAIAAVITQIMHDEQAMAATPQNRQRLSDWVLASHTEAFIPPRAPAKPITRPASK